MKPEVKQKWVEALRSGEYEQGKDRLRSGDLFCCLGVLCDLHARETRSAWENGSYIGESGTLPLAVMEWAGLPDDRGDRVSIRGEAVMITSHNDHGRTFAEIANAIEEQL